MLFLQQLYSSVVCLPNLLLRVCVHYRLLDSRRLGIRANSSWANASRAALLLEAMELTKAHGPGLATHWRRVLATEIRWSRRHCKPIREG